MVHVSHGKVKKNFIQCFWYDIGRCLDNPVENLIKGIGHVSEYPTMHYFGNPRHTQSMIAYMILTEYFWKFQ